MIVLFDMFGVIARHQSREVMDTMSTSPDFWAAYWEHRPAYDRGDVTADEYWALVGHPPLVEQDVASWSRVDYEMVALLHELHNADRRIALLSNIPEDLARHFERTYAWLELFELCAFSCRIGHAKPDRAAFEWCRDALGDDDILFVDDRLENVRAAELVGMRGHHFTGIDSLRPALGAVKQV
ncbi:HAD-IA family hydrolase [Lentzea albida]|uniref:Putative hydrolase of the HAD superfamily n=1 Tax=Lentzea albida TaxID=65499 RepID=A0A1H9RUA9_9PSEU|nr:HAD-IA family hydrolase [Lentzea albida]SER76450.1 putative hydrolase of the HAD superfamily [Lentzea albida]